MDFICSQLPLIACLENSLRILSYDQGRFVGAVAARLREAGYTVHLVTCRSNQLGLPIGRARLYIIAIHSDSGISSYAPPGVIDPLPSPVSSTLWSLPMTRTAAPRPVSRPWHTASPVRPLPNVDLMSGPDPPT